MKKTVIVLVSFFVVFGFAFAYAMPQKLAANVINVKTGEVVSTIFVPEQAVGNAPSVVPLGEAYDNGKKVEGYAFIHYKKGFGKPATKPAKGGANVCYGFLASGAKWKTTESYVVAPEVDAAAVARDFDAWDSLVAFDIFGAQDIAGIADGVDTVAPDGKNEVMFGSISDPGVIGVAVVWGIFGGRPQSRQLVEFDVVFDNADFVWGDASVDPSVMDFENIATHEFGHAAGMSDLYDSGCSQETMYGYASEGETSKRTLEAGDIAGIKKLYQ